MKKLALLLLASSRAICNTAPPAQIPEEPANVPGEAASAAASASAKAESPDMGLAAGELPPPPPPPAEAFQSIPATLDGSPFEIKGAGTTTPVNADGNVTIALANYNIDCATRPAAVGDRVVTFTIPWQKGTKVDVATLKGKSTAASQFDEKKKKLDPVKAWKPSGSIEVLAAPTKGKTSGRVRVDVSNKQDGIKAEIPIRFCFPG
jgi:hypothetical protein